LRKEFLVKKFIVAMSILAASVVSASAADMAVRPSKAVAVMADPAPSWTGWYIGAQGGWSTGHANHSIITDGLGFLNAPFGPTNIDGGNYGAVLGYDWQLSPVWVFGLNTEINGGKLKGTFDNGIAQGFGPGGDDIYQSEVNWFGSTRVKLGAVIPGAPQLMVYGTAGLAYADIKGANGDGLGGFSALDERQGSGSKVDFGYTVGGGLSWMIPGTRLVLSGEGAFYDFGKTRINTVTNTGDAHVFDVDTQFTSWRGILSYRF
jgi:outer membrane immunogenic protein